MRWFMGIRLVMNVFRDEEERFSEKRTHTCSWTQQSVFNKGFDHRDCGLDLKAVLTGCVQLKKEIAVMD